MAAENSTQSNEQPAFDEELYKKNRKKFLGFVRLSIGLLIIIALGAGYLWFTNQKEFNSQRSKLNEEHKAIQEKHQKLNDDNR
jgi:uncharacterized protein HemX